MMNKSPEFRANRLAWRFRRSGGDGHIVREFRNLDLDSQAKLVGLTNLGADEIPAIGCYFNKNSWLLVTSHRLIWSREGTETSLSLAEVSDATISLEHLEKAGSKDRVQELTVVVTDGRRLFVQVEPGHPFSGIWNALKMVASSNA